MTADLDTRIAAVVADADFGRPTAAKRGHNPRFPYVPIVDHRGPDQPRGGHTRQIKGLAYETREEAVDAARRSIENERRLLAKKLADPRYRALRRSYGLPEEAVR